MPSLQTTRTTTSLQYTYTQDSLSLSLSLSPSLSLSLSLSRKRGGKARRGEKGAGAWHWPSTRRRRRRSSPENASVIGAAHKRHGDFLLRRVLHTYSIHVYTLLALSAMMIVANARGGTGGGWVIARIEQIHFAQLAQIDEKEKCRPRQPRADGTYECTAVRGGATRLQECAWWLMNLTIGIFYFRLKCFAV